MSGKCFLSGIWATLFLYLDVTQSTLIEFNYTKRRGTVNAKLHIT